MSLDMAVNIEGAQSVGMPGLYFDHTAVAASCDRLFEHLASTPEGHGS